MYEFKNEEHIIKALTTFFP